MKSPLQKKTPAFTLIELLVVITIVSILIFWAIPSYSNWGVVKGQKNGTLNNARLLHLATQSMSLDNLNFPGDHVEWTSWKSNGNVTPASVQTYFAALTNNNYLTEADLKKLTTAPGKGPGADAPNASNICFKIFAVQESSPSDQPLLVTKNWTPGGLTKDDPYGKEGFVMFAKGGSGGVYRRVTDVTSTNIFPASQGETVYNYNTLQ